MKQIHSSGYIHSNVSFRHRRIIGNLCVNFITQKRHFHQAAHEGMVYPGMSTRLLVQTWCGDSAAGGGFFLKDEG